MTEMHDYLTESHVLANRLLDVRFKGASKAALKQNCLAWLDANRYTQDRIRKEYAGNRMLESQLDLFDIAKTRIDNIIFQCDR